MDNENDPTRNEPVWRRRFDPPELDEEPKAEEPPKGYLPPPQRRTIQPATGGREFKPWFLVSYLGIVVAFAIGGAVVGQLVAQWAHVDIEEAVRNHRQNITSEIYDITLTDAMLAEKSGEELESINVDGRHTIGELAEEKRILISYEQIPAHFINGLITAEDKDFRRHQGVDIFGISRALWANLASGKVVQGGSTITQQLIKNLFLSPEQTYSRKIKEALLALQLEARYTKEEILTFYCNTVYFGHNRYGLEAASRYYFEKNCEDLNLQECALLAAIIRAPEVYTPYRNLIKAKGRRDMVLERMAEFGHISGEESEAAINAPILLRDRSGGGQLGAYMIEEVRQWLVERFGEQKTKGEGLRVYTTMDRRLQTTAERALRDGLYELSMRQPLGMRPGPDGELVPSPATFNLVDNNLYPEEYFHPDWKEPLVEKGFVHAVVTAVEKDEVTLRIGRSIIKANNKSIPTKLATREQQSDLSSFLRVGDVVPVRIDKGVLEEGEQEGGVLKEVTAVMLSQEPYTQAALVAIEVGTGRVLAMVGGFDFNISKWNAAVQAKRQTGSAFKPIVLASALEHNKVTLATTIFDEPTDFDDPNIPEMYEPDNYKHEYIGVTTVRDLIEKSRNIPAIKLMIYSGIDNTIATAKKMGVDEELPKILSLALGSIEMSLIDLTAVYSVFPNQGVAVEPYFIETVVGHDGEVLFRHSPNTREAISHTTAFLATQAMIGVVERGTGASALRIARQWGIPLAGKTGTTDDYTDAWFVGFSPQIVCGVWVGNDEKVTIGDDESGARAALPIWRRFMSAVLEDEQWRRVGGYKSPMSVRAREIDRRIGLLASNLTPEDQRIFEWFRKGSEPINSTTYQDDLNLRKDWRAMEKTVNIRFENDPIVKPRY